MLFERRKAKQLVLLVSLHYASLQFFAAAQGELVEPLQPTRQHTSAPLPPLDALADQFLQSKDAQLRQHKSASRRRRRDQQANHVLHPELLLEPAQAPRFDTGAGRQQRNPKKKYQAHERYSAVSVQRQSCFSVGRL